MSDKRRLDNTEKATVSQEKKKKKTSKRINFDKYFDIGSAEKNEQPFVNRSSNSTETPTTNENAKSPSIDVNDRNANTQNLLSNEQLIHMFKQFSAVSQVAVKSLKSVCERVHQHRTKSSLRIRETEISEEDAPLLVLFEKYNLPLKTKEEVETLDVELEKSNDFLKFFVSFYLIYVLLTNNTLIKSAVF